MKLYSHMKVVRVADLADGELVQITKSEQTGLGIVIANPEGTRRSALLLQQVLGARPFSNLVNLPGETIVSYGKDWVLEPVSTEETTLNNPKTYGINGVLRLTAGDIVLEATDPTGYADGLFYSLNSNSKADIALQNSLAFSKWKIWASEVHREHEGGTPLMEFDAEAAAAARY